jgi:hypothetical protein
MLAFSLVSNKISHANIYTQVRMTFGLRGQKEEAWST